MDALTVLQQGPVIPVIVIEDAAKAVRMGRALVAGGVRVLEITLRTPAALEAVRALSAEVPEAIVGVGTVLEAKQFAEARKAGAQFAISPGFTPSLIDAAADAGISYLPGVTSPTEMMGAMEKGLTTLKFFPAEAAGGIPMLKSFASPFPTVKFCPTGGISLSSAPSYLALPNVVCVGGSWLVPPEAVRDNNWAEVTRLAQEAAALKRA